jgi:DNA-directed RNA polymerase specialized sigma24 family protein
LPVAGARLRNSNAESTKMRRPASTNPIPLSQRSTAARLAEPYRLRDDLATARQRYKDAVFAARTAGYSWTEIGRLLGVSRQQVHRQFRAL